MRVSGIAAWSLLTAIAATEAFVPSEPNGRVGGARRRLAPRRRLLPAPASADDPSEDPSAPHYCTWTNYIEVPPVNCIPQHNG